MFKNVEGYTYRVGESIGKGYSSTVHKGIKDATGEDVSIKVIQMAKLEDPINQLLLQFQVSSLRKLRQSPHVLHLFDVFATKNNTYIITELCEGDLATSLKNRNLIHYLEAVDILQQLLRGLLDIHKAGFLHRDIKPANILHKNHIFKIADFGFAVPLADLHSHTQYNVGSPVYMSPEALRDNLYSFTSDAWGLGIIFYQMIKGVVPWRAPTQKILHQKIVKEPIATLTEGLPAVAKQFLAKVLNLEVQHRLPVEQMLKWIQPLSNIQTLRKLSIPADNFNLGPKSVTQTPKQSKIQRPMCGRTTLGPCNRTNDAKKASKEELNFLKRKQSSHSFTNENTANFSHQRSFKEATFISRSMICYLKFLHRVLQFTRDCKKVRTIELQNALRHHLFEELDYIQKIVLVSPKEIEQWSQFLQSSKGETFKKNLLKKKSKYRIFYPTKQNEKSLTKELIQEAFKQQVDSINQGEWFDQRKAISCDYMITLYQLLALRKKYNLKDFLLASKVDIIVEGDPYGVNRQHIEKIKQKAKLVGVNF